MHMKKIGLLLSLVVLMACAGKTDKDTAGAGDETAAAAEWVTVTLDVEGMTCEGCEKAIQAGVESIEGVDSVESSFEEGWTRVKYDANTASLEQITGSITETGYKVVTGEESGTAP